MRSRATLLAALLIVALVATACGGQKTSEPTANPAPDSQSSTPSTPTAASGGVLRIGQTGADLATLDPHYASSTQDRALVDMVYNALVRFKPGKAPELEADLATELPVPELVDGKQVWTFKLRQGVMCHGTANVPAYELTSEDVVWSLNKSATADTSAYAASYAGMTFAAVDPYTVRVTLDTPMSPSLFLPNFANYNGGYIICKKPAEQLGLEGLKTHPVGTGPFVFKEYLPKEKVVLTANPDYFRGKPRLDGIDYRYMPDTNSRELAVRNGQVDLIYGPADDIWVQKVEAVPGLKVDVFGPGEVVMIQFNVTQPPLDDVRVRQALAYALSRDEFHALFGTRVGEKVFAPVPHFVLGGLTEQDVKSAGLAYEHNLDKARELLTEAGYPNGFELPEMATSEMEAYKKAYESMQAQLAKVGVRFNLKTVDHSSFHSLIRQDANPITIYIAFRPNAEIYLRNFHHSDSIVVTGPKPNTNFAHYDQVDGLIDQALAEIDPDKQKALWRDAQLQILKDMGMYSAATTNQVYVRTEKLNYGHELHTVFNLYPGIDETTHFVQ